MPNKRQNAARKARYNIKYKARRMNENKINRTQEEEEWKKKHTM